MRDVWGQALSLPPLRVLGAGSRGAPPTFRWCGRAVVGTLHFQLPVLGADNWVCVCEVGVVSVWLPGCMVPLFAVLPPSFRCPCAPLSSSAACCCVVRAVVLWLVAVLPARRASLALLPWSSSAVYRVIPFCSFLARLSSLLLPCGLLFAFCGRRRVGASYPFVYPSGRPSSLARLLPCPVRVWLCIFGASAPSLTCRTAYGGVGCGRGDLE